MAIENSSQWNAVVNGKFSIIKNKLTDEGGELHIKYESSIPPLILEHVQSRFWTETTPDGESWQSLADLTIELKTKAGYQYIQHPGILQATRSMYKSLDAKSVGGWEISFGTDDPIAKKHQYGSLKIPARPFLGWNNEMEFSVRNKLQSLIDEVSLTL